MKNIPVFTTEYGVATLVLKEIPYQEVAYVLIRDTDTPAEFIAECVGFCRAAGAEHIYATGSDFLEKYPFHTTVIKLKRSRSGLKQSNAVLRPVTEASLPEWLSIYNRGMGNVPNAAYMAVADGKEMLARGDGYYIENNGEIIGIGIAGKDSVDAVVACKGGAGEACMLALNGALDGDWITLTVASTNERAYRLYSRMGFTLEGELSKWYKIY